MHQASVWLATSRAEVFSSDGNASRLHLKRRFVEDFLGILLRAQHVAEADSRILVDFQPRRFPNRLPQSVGQRLAVFPDERGVVHDVGQRAIIDKRALGAVEHEAVRARVVIDRRGAELPRVVASLLLGSILNTFLATHHHQGCNSAKNRLFHRQFQNFWQSYEKYSLFSHFFRIFAGQMKMLI